MNWLQQVATWLGRLKLWFVVRPWESGIRLRFGRNPRVFGPGFHFRWPIVDETFVQNTRLRVLNLPVQTVSTRFGVAITITATVEWQVENLLNLYSGLHVPEDWIYNRTLAAMASVIFALEGTTLDPVALAAEAQSRLAGAEAFGLRIGQVKVVNLAQVRTYRLIDGEGHGGWSWDRVGALASQHP